MTRHIPIKRFASVLALGVLGINATGAAAAPAQASLTGSGVIVLPQGFPPAFCGRSGPD